MVEFEHINMCILFASLLCLVTESQKHYISPQNEFNIFTMIVVSCSQWGVCGVAR